MSDNIHIFWDNTNIGWERKIQLRFLSRRFPVMQFEPI